MRKYIYILSITQILVLLLLLFVLLPNIAQAGNVKTGAQLVQELCSQARYAFCGNSFSHGNVSYDSSLGPWDAGTSVRKIQVDPSSLNLSGSTQWYRIERISRTTARITDLRTGRRVDLYGPLNNWNTAWLNGAKVQVGHLKFWSTDVLSAYVYCPSGTRVVPSGATADGQAWPYYSGSAPKTIGCD